MPKYQRMFKLLYNLLTSHASNVMLKILQARIQQYVNWELPDTQAGFWRVGGTRDQIANILWIMEKAREFQKIIYFCFVDYAKAFECVDHKNYGKFLKRWEHQTIVCVSWETYMQVKKQQLQSDMEQPTCSKLGKKYNKAVYRHSAYLILCRVHLLF